MQKNVEKKDKIIRFLIAVFLLWQGLILSNIILLALGAILVLTIIFSRCGIYKILGINTCKILEIKDNENLM